jgi:hypothetical protein
VTAIMTAPAESASTLAQPITGKGLCASPT